MGKKFKTITIGVLIVVLCIGYYVYGETEKFVDSALLYENDQEISYKIINNRMIDTYIIATALYMDFNSNTIMPNTNSYPIYKKAKEYFQPYKNHQFINEFKNYVVNGDINGDAIGVLLSYDSSPNLIKLGEIDEKYRAYIFKDEEQIDKFINGLMRFYKDTNADAFFEENSQLLSISKKYLEGTVGDSKLVALIKHMEEYLNSSNFIYNKKPIEYETVITIFRPSYASFYSVCTGEKNRLITFQSLSDYTGDPYKLDINNMVENTIHELLHSYINREVSNIIDNRKELPRDKIMLTNNMMYNNMPLHRQADEYIVRAIEGRLYKSIFDEQYTFNRLLYKEINYGGFNELEKYYNHLQEYELNKKEYEDITKFLPIIIEELIAGDEDMIE